jgi:hypothetical protein
MYETVRPVLVVLRLVIARRRRASLLLRAVDAILGTHDWLARPLDRFVGQFWAGT